MDFGSDHHDLFFFDVEVGLHRAAFFDWRGHQVTQKILYLGQSSFDFFFGWRSVVVVIAATKSEDRQKSIDDFREDRADARFVVAIV